MAEARKKPFFLWSSPAQARTALARGLEAEHTGSAEAAGAARASPAVAASENMKHIGIPYCDVRGGLRGRCARAAGPPGRRAGDCDSPPLLATLGRAIDRPRIDMAGEAVTAMIVAADAGDNPLADRREDREAAAARERKAKVAKLNSQTANAMEVVRAQQAAKEQGAFDEAAIRAN